LMASKEGRNALHVAVTQRQFDKVRKIVSAPSDAWMINGVDELGNTPLHIASQNSFEAIVRLLLELQANPNVRNLAGETSLFIACRYHGAEKVVMTLLMFKADPNIPDNNGETPLHIATVNQYTRTVQLLLERGADLATQNSEGKTAIEIATDKNYSDLVILMKRYQVPPKEARAVANSNLIDFDAASAQTSSDSNVAADASPLKTCKPKDPFELEDETLCIVCCECKREVTLVPCGHVCLCYVCANKVQECPICKTKIERILKVYFP